MTQEDIAELMIDATKFPLPLRIAMKLHGEGIKSDDLIVQHHSVIFREVSDATYTQVCNHLRDLERNQHGLRPKAMVQLNELAKKL